MSKFNWFSIQVALLFIVLVLGSFIPELYPTFFGDWKCGGWIEGKEKFCYEDSWYHLPTWHWGYRHILFCVMGIILFIIQAVRIADKLNEK